MRLLPKVTTLAVLVTAAARPATADGGEWIERADMYLMALDAGAAGLSGSEGGWAVVDAVTRARESLEAATPPPWAELRTRLASTERTRRQALAMLSVMNCPPDDVVIEALRDRSPDDLEARWLVAWIAGRLGGASVQRNADQLVERFEREDSAFVVAAARPAIERLDPRRQTIVLSAIAQHGLAKVAYIIAESQPGGVDRLLARLRESGARDAEREVLSLRRRDEERTRR